jgi:uracil-DNA glycosylase
VFYITKNWYDILKGEFDKDYFKTLQKFLKEEYNGQTIYPEAKNVFAALNLTRFNDVKVVIIGQDPYINPRQAHGLCFSVESTEPPPSLKNIYKELMDDCGCSLPKGGNLTNWAKQGVLLLNSVLTVRAGMSFSHKGKGWEEFTHKIIELLSKREDPIIFLVWGSGARKILEDIDISRHKVLFAAHPSPLSAQNGFFGCRHFSKANQILKEWNKPEIDWQIE